PMIGQSHDFTPKRTVLGVGALAAAATLALGACSSSGGSDPTLPPATGTSSAVVSTPPPEPVTTGSAPASTGSASPATSSGSAVALAKDTIAAMNSAQSFRLVASGTSDGSALDVDMHYGADSSKGSISSQGITMQLISADGQIYFKAPDSFWKQQVPES